MKSIQLGLTLDEINIILEALGEQPYIKVHQLIATIHQQATAQLQESDKDNQTAVAQSEWKA